MKKAIFCILVFSISLQTYADKSFHAVFFTSGMQLNPIYAINMEEAQLFTAIHEGLAKVHPQYLYPVPAMAESWKVSSDGRVYTFTLRDNLYFSNGEKITAEHFVRSWMQHLEAGEQAMFAAMFDVIQGAKQYRIKGRGSVGMEAPSEDVFRVTLESPAPHFLKLITHHSFMLVHPSLLEESNWIDSSLPLVTSGPYKIQSLSQEEFILIPNQHHYSSPELLEIKITFEKDPEVITEDFNQKKIDWVLTTVNANELNDRRHIVFNSTFSSTFLFFRVDKEPWNDPRVRKALALLLPWEQIHQMIIGLRLPTHTLVPTIDNYPTPATISEQDAEAAFALLSEAGYSEDNLLPPIRVVLPYLSPEQDPNLETILAETWGVVSENVEVGAQELDYIPFLKYGDYTVGSMSWIGDYTDPLAFLEMWRAESELNFSHYRDEVYEEHIYDSMHERDATNRYAILSEAESMLLENAVILPISHGIAINIIDLERVKGWYPNPLDIHPFSALSLDDSTSRGIVSR